MAWTIAPSAAFQLIVAMSQNAPATAAQHEQLAQALRQVESECIAPAMKQLEEKAKKESKDVKESPKPAK